MPEYFTTPELRALPGMSDAVKYPDAAVELAAAFVVARIEREAFPFLERTVTGEVHSGTRANRHNRAVTLKQRFVRSVTAVVENGVAFDAAALAELSIKGGVVQRFTAGTFDVPVPWAEGVRNLVWTYKHGWSAVVPDDVKGIALEATRHRLVTQYGTVGASDRATSMTTPEGTVKLSTAGIDGPFGLPDVDAVIKAYAKQRTPLVR